MADGCEGEELFTLEPAVIDREVNAMGCEPGGAAAKLRDCGRFIGRHFALYTGFAGLALFAVVEGEDKIVRRIIESHELQMGLESQAGRCIESCDLFERERIVIGVVERLYKSPFDSGHIDR